MRSNSSRSKGKEYARIPVTSNASFEEVLTFYGNNNDLPKPIDELAELLTSTGCEQRVQLVEKSTDICRTFSHDLPVNFDIMLTNVFVERAVFASVDSPDGPIFHIPLRTAINVTLLGQVDRGASPLLDSVRQSSSPLKVSTLDRCAEMLSADTVSWLRQTVLDAPQPSLK
jgi:hypothetical protein